MNKRSAIVIVVLIVLGFTYYQLITRHVSVLDSHDRSILLYNYDEKNYFGSFDSEDHHFNVIELDEQLSIDGNKVIGDFNSSEKLVKYLDDSLKYNIEDVFEFDNNNKLITNNLNDESKELYSEIADYHQVITKILIDGDIKQYHPKYNNILVRIGSDMEIDEDGETTTLVEDGVMTKRVVKKMIKAGVTEEDIDNAFVSIVTPALECEEKVCTVIEPYYNEIRKEFNKDTEHDLPEYSEITKKEE